MMRYYIFLFVALLSCSKPDCTNSNPVFNKYAPNTKQYNEELARQLKKHKPNQLRYWIESTAISGNREYLVAEVQGEDLCAMLWLDITNDGDRKMEHVKLVKARSYEGAALLGLKYQVAENEDGYHFVYQSVEVVLD